MKIIVYSDSHGCKSKVQYMYEKEKDADFCFFLGDGINEEQTTYEFEGGNSVYLSQLLADLKYSPEKLCKCLPEYKVDTEYKLGYGISLGEAPYARCDQGQAELTKEQAEKIQTIIEEVKSGKIF